MGTFFTQTRSSQTNRLGNRRPGAMPARGRPTGAGRASSLCGCGAMIDGRWRSCRARPGHDGAHHTGWLWWGDRLDQAGTLAEQDACGW